MAFLQSLRWRGGGSDYAGGLQVSELSGIDPEPALQHVGGVAAERRGAFHLDALAVDPYRPTRHLVVAVMVVDLLHEAAFFEIGLVLQFQRIEHRTRRHADRD